MALRSLVTSRGVRWLVRGRVLCLLHLATNTAQTTALRSSPLDQLDSFLPCHTSVDPRQEIHHSPLETEHCTTLHHPSRRHSGIPHPDDRHSRACQRRAGN